MNTVQTTSSNQEKVNNLIRNQRNEKRKESEVSSDSAAKRANTIKNKQKTALAANKKTTNEAEGKKGNDKLEINEYLKILSRLENKLNLDQLEDDDLDKISTSLEEKILSLTDLQQTRLRSTQFFKENGIENINDLKKTLFDLFKDVDERDALFEFLRSSEFTGMLLNEPDKPITYSASINPNVGMSAKV
jgi:uncharacterized protein with von Willebrand factor type A (vWA) domain